MRLGDLDALKEKVNTFYDSHFKAIGLSTFAKAVNIYIDNAPSVKPKLSNEQIEEITDLLENEWGYEGMREDVERILRGAENDT